MLVDGVPVGHPGDIITNCSLQAAGWNPSLYMVWKDERFEAVCIEQIGDDLLGFDLHAHDTVMPVEIGIKKILQFAVAGVAYLRYIR